MDNDFVVSTSSGRFRGQVEGGVISYLGIPYAEPPVGALRFRSPQPARPASDVVDASRFGAASLQTSPVATSAGRSIFLDGHVPKLTGQASRAANQLAVEEHPNANSF